MEEKIIRCEIIKLSIRSIDKVLVELDKFKFLILYILMVDIIDPLSLKETFKYFFQLI